LAVAAALLILASCGGGGGSSSPTTVATTSSTSTSTTVAPTTTTIDYGQQYLAIVAPANAETAVFTAAAQRYDQKQITLPQLGAEATKLANVLRGVDEQLLRVSWPPDVKPLIQNLVTADFSLVSDLDRVGSLTAFEIPGWVQQITADEGKFEGAVAVVRAELHLSPAPK
jgi:hypothetical protein